MDAPSDAFLWVKALHIIAVVCWFAALIYLPRLYVYHAMSDDATKSSALSNHGTQAISRHYVARNDCYTDHGALPRRLGDATDTTMKRFGST